MAASMTAEKAKEVASLPKVQGCSLLAQHLGWKPNSTGTSSTGDDANLREAIRLEYLYDNLMFAVGRGFPWRQVCSAMQLADEIQQQTVGKPLSEGIELYLRKSSEYSLDGSISPDNLKIFTTHLFATFMMHYRLFQFVFTKLQRPMVTDVNVEVETPPDVPPLKDSKPERIWEYDEKLAAIELEEKARRAVLTAETEELQGVANDFEKPLCGLHDSSSEVLNRETVLAAVREAGSLRASHTERLLQAEVESTNEDLHYYLERTALPRPAALGPPPRTKKPAALSSPKGKAASGGEKQGDPTKASAKSSRSIKTPKSVKN